MGLTPGVDEIVTLVERRLVRVADLLVGVEARMRGVDNRDHCSLHGNSSVPTRSCIVHTGGTGRDRALCG